MGLKQKVVVMNTGCGANEATLGCFRLSSLALEKHLTEGGVGRECRYNPKP